MQRIQEIMTPNPETCEMDHPVTCALQIMKNANCGAVPIVDKDNKIRGIVTDRDIALCMLNNPRSPQDIQVQNCVKHHDEQVITVRPEDDVHRAIDLMEEHQVRRLPVCDENRRLIGIVAQADIALKDTNPQEVSELVKEVSAQRHSMGANP